jgi:hypothetical protein
VLRAPHNVSSCQLSKWKNRWKTRVFVEAVSVLLGGGRQYTGPYRCRAPHQGPAPQLWVIRTLPWSPHFKLLSWCWCPLPEDSHKIKLQKWVQGGNLWALLEKALEDQHQNRQVFMFMFSANLPAPDHYNIGKFLSFTVLSNLYGLSFSICSLQQAYKVDGLIIPITQT